MKIITSIILTLITLTTCFFGLAMKPEPPTDDKLEMFLNCISEKGKTMENNYDYAIKLYDEYGGLVERHCKAELDEHPDLADDCIQNVFLELIEVLNNGVILLSPVKWFVETSNKYINEACAKISCWDLGFLSTAEIPTGNRTRLQIINNESED